MTIRRIMWIFLGIGAGALLLAACGQFLLHWKRELVGSWAGIGVAYLLCGLLMRLLPRWWKEYCDDEYARPAGRRYMRALWPILIGYALVLAGIMSLEAASMLGMSLDFANIIALPLMFGVGVAFHIYYLIAWRNGQTDMLASSLTRAIFFSSLTTGVAFGSLCLSSHPGTAGMGKLLALSLFFTLVAAFLIVPAFLGPPPAPAAKPEATKS